MKVIVWREFELSYFDAAVYHFSHYAVETPSNTVIRRNLASLSENDIKSMWLMM